MMSVVPGQNGLINLGEQSQLVHAVARRPYSDFFSPKAVLEAPDVPGDRCQKKHSQVGESRQQV